MHKRIQYILSFAFTFMVIALLTSCSKENLFEQDSNSYVQIIGRIPNFDQHYVNTKSIKTSEENVINNMTLLIFNRQNTLKDIQKIEGSAAIFIVDKTTLDVTDTLYLLANVNHLFDQSWTKTSQKSITDLETIIEHHSTVGIPRTGFPMVGSQPLTETVINSQKIQISLEMLYAKIELNIKLDAEQLKPHSPTFEITDCFVHNIPEGVHLINNRENDGQTKLNNRVIEGGIRLESKESIDNVLDNGETYKLTFYMPEHSVIPTKKIEYPKANMTDIEKQRFKPLFVEDGLGNYTETSGLATYVIINGNYIDHQGHLNKVSYKVYLGKNAVNNFEILGNEHHINDIKILGITNSNDLGENKNNPNRIYIDHRVSIERNNYIIYMEREALLDCHYEVRPIRIYLDTDKSGQGFADTVTIEITSMDKDNPDDPDWIKLEQKKTSGGDANTYCENGKRKYFTKELLKDDRLVDSCTVTDNTNNCVWVYIDEYIRFVNLSNLTLQNNEEEIKTRLEEQKHKQRTATIRITYKPKDSSDSEIKEYTFTQQCLYPVISSQGRTNADGSPYVYYIEFQEEYLHNFDSYDGYGLTNYEGMEWGLDGVQLSHHHDAYYLDGKVWRGAIGIFNELLSNIKYDFYISKEESANGKYFPYNGYSFTTEIIDYLKETDNAINTVSLDNKPESAIEYCYNKNKAKVVEGDATITDINWYMPSIDELEDIIGSAYTEFEVFQEKYYWSCQPAYTICPLYSAANKKKFIEAVINGVTSNGALYQDNLSNARATRMIYKGFVDEKDKYEIAKSGVQQSNLGCFVANGGNEYGTVDFSTPNSDNNNTQIELVVFDGNKPRTTECRVRAIYKP